MWHSLAIALGFIIMASSSHADECGELRAKLQDEHRSRLAEIRQCNQANSALPWGGVVTGPCANWGPKVCTSLAESCSASYNKARLLVQDCAVKAARARGEVLQRQAALERLRESGFDEVVSYAAELFLEKPPVPVYLFAGREMAMLLGPEEAEKALRRNASSKLLERLSREVAQRGLKIAELHASYIQSCLATRCTKEIEEGFVERIGDLHNRNSRVLQLYFGAKLYRPGYKDGTVLAREQIRSLASEHAKHSLQAAADRIYQVIQSSKGSAYTSMTREDILKSLEDAAHR
jgi:hypothetical protein